VRACVRAARVRAFVGRARIVRPGKTAAAGVHVSRTVRMNVTRTRRGKT